DNWQEWRDSFLRTYGGTSWDKIRAAYDFKYLKGSLLTYALRKENLRLEVQPTMTDLTRIHLIVLGLPVSYQRQIRVDDITTTEKLFRHFARLRKDTSTEKKTNVLGLQFVRETSRSNVTVIKKEALDKSIPVYPNSKSLKTLSGPLKCTTVMWLNLKIQDIEQEVLNYDMLLGLDAIKKFRLIQGEKLNVYQKDLKNRIFRINNRR
ncbi:hypothetical protein RUM43_015083, partial [Polyplax serrata]